MNPQPTRHVLVVGCGIAGMCTALAMARRGYRVTVIERDTAPPDGDADQAFFAWPRRGAAQFRHPHAFLGLMCNLLQDSYPDLLDAFYEAGARRLDFKDMLSAELSGRYRPAPGDERLWVLLCRRATIETVLRRYVAGYPSIHILNDVTVDGLIADRDEGSLSVRGVKLRRDSVAEHGQAIVADIVVDASGRGSRFPRWLGEHGACVREENDDAEIVYYTRHYRLKPGVAEPSRQAKDRAAGDLGYLKYGVFPGDNGNFAIIVCLHRVEQELHEAVTQGERFDRICRSIPGLAPWVAESAAEATTEPFGIGDIRAVWRHYVEDGEPVAHHFFAVGDAALRTNPLYGRGCSTGILHAHLLAEVLAEVDDPRERARTFDARTEEALRPIFHDQPDRGPQRHPPRPGSRPGRASGGTGRLAPAFRRGIRRCSGRSRALQPARHARHAAYRQPAGKARSVPSGPPHPHDRAPVHAARPAPQCPGAPSARPEPHADARDRRLTGQHSVHSTIIRHSARQRSRPSPPAGRSQPAPPRPGDERPPPPWPSPAARR
jgi:2-polyprenyl-6-methoxyphenol hydroxylase-like FAD-dependent oxidoreductase